MAWLGLDGSVGCYGRSQDVSGRSWEVSGRSLEVSGKSWDVSLRSVGGPGRSVGGHARSVWGHGRSVGGHGRSVGGHGRSVGGHGRSVGGHGKSVGGQETSVAGHARSFKILELHSAHHHWYTPYKYNLSAEGAKAYKKEQTSSHFVFLFFLFSWFKSFAYGQVDRLFQMSHGAISPSFMVLFNFSYRGWGGSSQFPKTLF